MKTNKFQKYTAKTSGNEEQIPDEYKNVKVIKLPPRIVSRSKDGSNYSPREIDRLYEDRRRQRIESERIQSQNDIALFEIKLGISEETDFVPQKVPPMPRDDDSLDDLKRIPIIRHNNDSLPPVVSRLYSEDKGAHQHYMHQSCPYCSPDNFNRTYQRPATSSMFQTARQSGSRVQRVHRNSGPVDFKPSFSLYTRSTKSPSRMDRAPIDVRSNTPALTAEDEKTQTSRSLRSFPIRTKSSMSRIDYEALDYLEKFDKSMKIRSV